MHWMPFFELKKEEKKKSTWRVSGPACSGCTSVVPARMVHAQWLYVRVSQWEKCKVPKYCPAFWLKCHNNDPFGDCNAFWGHSSSSSPFTLVVLAHVAPFHPLSDTVFPLLFLKSFHDLCFSVFKSAINTALQREGTPEGWKDGSGRGAFFPLISPSSSAPLHLNLFFHLTPLHSWLSFPGGLSRLLPSFPGADRAGFILTGQIEVSLLPLWAEEEMEGEREEGRKGGGWNHKNRIISCYNQSYIIMYVVLEHRMVSAASVRSNTTYSESDSLSPLTVPDFKCMATPPLVSR